MAAPTREDGVLMVQVAQWMAMLNFQDSMAEVMRSDFDPSTADPRSDAVRAVLGVFETIGTLTKNGLLSAELVRDWLWVEGIWARVGPAALKVRAEAGEDRLYENFEALATGA